MLTSMLNEQLAAAMEGASEGMKAATCGMNDTSVKLMEVTTNTRTPSSAHQ